MKLRSRLIALAIATMTCCAGGAAGQSCPNKPIRFLVAQTPGSSIDAISRVVATRMGELLGQQFVIDNRTGAGGIIAGVIVAKEWKNLGDAIRASNLKVD